MVEFMYYYNDDVLNKNAKQPDVYLTEEEAQAKADEAAKAAISNNGLARLVDDANTSSLVNVKASDFPEGITKIAPYTFYWAKTLGDIELPEGITSIGDSFCSQSSVTKIVFPDSYKTYPNATVQYCSHLTTVVFGANLSLFGNSTSAAIFQGCSKLTAVVFKRTSGVVILNGKPNSTITSYYVPDALVDSYKASSYWSAYADYIKPLSEWEG